MTEALAETPPPIATPASAPVMQALSLDITGMTCAACAGRIERALARVPGVSDASVNLATEVAKGRFEGDGPGLDALLAAVDKAGYQAAPHRPRAALQAGQQAADRRAAWQVLAAALLSAPLVLPMLLAPLGIHAMLPGWWQFALATPVQFVLGARFYVAGWRAALAGEGNMDLLVAIGTSAAWGLSVQQLLAHGDGHGTHLYFEGAAVVITLVMFGKWLEARARRRTTDAISALQLLRPDQALLRRDGQTMSVPLDAVFVGDELVVRPGERIPLDGLILEGETRVDESPITGESRLRGRAHGHAVVGGGGPVYTSVASDEQ